MCISFIVAQSETYFKSTRVDQKLAYLFEYMTELYKTYAEYKVYIS